MTVKKTATDENISFEEALERLEKLLREMEGGQQPLQEAIDLFSEGMELARVCSRHLEDAEKQLAILTADENGQPQLQEADQL